MLMSLWFVAVGLIFGWCAMLLTIDTPLPVWARALVTLVVATIAGYLFDFVALQAGHAIMAVGGAAVGGLIAAGAHELWAYGLERRPPRKEPNNS